MVSQIAAKQPARCPHARILALSAFGDGRADTSIQCLLRDGHDGAHSLGSLEWHGWWDSGLVAS